MRVQNDGVSRKAIQDIVFYGLTRLDFAVTVTLSCFPALSSPGRQASRTKRGGTALVNRAEASGLVVKKNHDAPMFEQFRLSPRRQNSRKSAAWLNSLRKNEKSRFLAGGRPAWQGTDKGLVDTSKLVPFPISVRSFPQPVKPCSFKTGNANCVSRSFRCSN